MNLSKDDKSNQAVVFELDAFMRETETRLQELMKKQEGYLVQLRIPRTVGILEEALSRVTNEIEDLEKLLAHYKAKRELSELIRHLSWIESEINLIETNRAPQAGLAALEARRDRLAKQAAKLEDKLVAERKLTTPCSR